MIAQRSQSTQLNAPILPLLAPDFDRMRTHILDVTDNYNREKELNSILLSENYAMKEEIERLNAHIDRDANTFSWMQKLFSNKKIPMAVKLVLWQYFMFISHMRPNLTDECQIRMDKVAEAIGIDPATVRRATDKAENFDILERRYETVENDEGETRRYVYISLGEVVAHPEDIHMEKIQGGARVRRCPKDQSENVDRYTVQYCRDCDTLSWYGQPGLRTDADVRKAQHACNHMTHPTIDRAAAPDDASEKQDAFLPDPTMEISNRIENAIDQADRKMVAALAANISSQAPEKQDAFLPVEQVVTEHTHRDRSKLQDAFQVWGDVEIKTCHAEFQLNKKGQLAHKLEPVVSTRICGSSRWQWSEEDNCQVCEECWTPKEEKQ